MVAAYISIAFLILAIIFFIISARQKKEAGMPAGRVIYSDTNQWLKMEKPLFDRDLKLAGKPDYLVQQGKQIIPVEVKSGKAPQAPYDSHIYQLGAYCYLVNHEYGQRPSYGLIHYPSHTFEVEYTPALEETVIETIREMQGKSTRSQVDRSHDEPKRCMHCGYRSICDQSLRL